MSSLYPPQSYPPKSQISNNELSIYEKAVIRDVYKKIRDDDIANKQYEIYRQQDQRNKQSDKNSKEKRRSIKIKAVGILCVGSLAYATATLITR
jgi:CRISPR/Cas system CMR subunit Cmr6 (Cas7 group RAMP superfamily)